MTNRSSADSDAVAVRKATRRIGWQITAGAAVIVAIVVLASVAYIAYQSRRSEMLEKPRPGDAKIYVDSRDVLIALAVVGLIAIIVAGVLSRLVAARAVRPLGDALRMQRTFVADASHELRTPLAVLDARIQVLQRHLPSDAHTAQEVAQLRSDSQGLISVVNDLLLAASMDSPEQDMSVTDVSAAVTEAADSMRLLAAKKAITIDVDAAAGMMARIPATSIRRCLIALLDNAIAHAPATSTVSVAVGRALSTVEISVADRGNGISGIEPDRIFERFARSSDAIDNGSGRTGFGIGLALVREIAVRHGGSVEVRTTGTAGTTFVITLPRLDLGTV